MVKTGFRPHSQAGGICFQHSVAAEHSIHNTTIQMADDGLITVQVQYDYCGGDETFPES